MDGDTNIDDIDDEEMDFSHLESMTHDEILELIKNAQRKALLTSIQKTKSRYYEDNKLIDDGTLFATLKTKMNATHDGVLSFYALDFTVFDDSETPIHQYHQDLAS